MFKDQELLLKTLVDKKKLNPSQIDKLKKEKKDSGKTPEQIIIEKDIINEEELTKIKGELLGVPYIDLSARILSSEILNTIPKKVAENYKIIAFERIKNQLKVAMVDPQNFKAIEAIEFLAKESDFEVQYFIISLKGFRIAFKQYQMLTEEAEEVLSRVTETTFEPIEKLEREGPIEEVVKSAPVSKMVLVIMRHAIEGRASDIHIEPQIRDTRVRYRIDGILYTSLVLPKYIHSAVVSRIKVLANLKLDETRKPQDGRIRLKLEDRSVDFRISTLPLFEGEKVVLRVLDTSNRALTLQQLGFNSNHIETIERGIKSPHGMLLSTGPTGSGKTTTLYSILTILNQEGINIITLEDPIEYYIEGVNQSQINPEVGFTFASGLRSILRQDPNIIMVGEIRDEETTELAIHAGLTGHLVLSTLHTNDSLGAIPRLIDMGSKPFLLASTINFIIAQRLARRICQQCKEESKISDRILTEIKKEIGDIPESYLESIKSPIKFWNSKGCAHCGNLGYQGRIAISEVIDFTPAMQEIVNSGFKSSDIGKELTKQNFITLRQDALIKATQGVISLEEVLRVTEI